MSVSGGADRKAYIYKYGAENGRFEEYLEKGFEEAVDHVVISEDKNWVVVSELDHAHVLSGLEVGRLENEQWIYTADQRFAKFSKDSRHLFLGKASEGLVFRLCGGRENYEYNYKEKSCEKCRHGRDSRGCLAPSPSVKTA